MLNSQVSFHHRLQSAFREALALPPNFDVSSIESRTLSAWDSVAHLQLVVAIEEAFGIELAPGDILDMQSYWAAVKILRGHGVATDD